MALPRIEVEIGADTAQAEAGFERVEKGMAGVGSAADRASSRTEQFGRGLNRQIGTQRRFGSGIQNTAFQLGDFATQVGAGTSASIALGQQLPQLLGGFGALGAVLGAVVAVGVPLTRAFSGMADSGRDLTTVFGTLQPMAEAVADAFSSIQSIGVEMAEVVINNIDRILVVAGTAATFFAGRWVASFVAARVATLGLASALVMVRRALFRTGIGALIVLAGELVYQFTRLVDAAGGFGKAFGLVAEVVTQGFKNIDDVAFAVGETLVGAASSFNAAFLNAFASIAEKWDDLVNKIINSPLINWLSAFGMNGPEGFDVSNISEGLREQADKLEERASSAFGNAAENINTAIPALGKIRELLAGMKNEKITLPDILGGGNGEGGEGGEEKTLNEKLTAQEERVREHVERIKALTVGGLSDQLSAWGNYFGNLATLTGTNNKKLLGLQKSFAAASALINAWEAYNQVLSDPTLPWYAKAAAAGSVLAAGIGAVNAIKGVTSGGSTSAGGGAGGVAGGQQQAQRLPEQRIIIDAQGANTTDFRTTEALIEQMNEAGRRGVRLSPVLIGGT